MKSTEIQGVHSLSRGLRILCCFDTANPCWRVGELSRHLNLNRGTVHRYVKTLESEGLLAMDPVTGKYHVGFRAYQLGKVSNLQSELVKLARPHMESLVESSSETVGLATWVGDGVLFLDVAIGPGPFEPRRLAGQISRDFRGAHAKVYLAFLPEEERQELLLQAQEGPDKVERDDLDNLATELRQVVLDEVAYDIGAAIQGVCVIAAPVYDVDCQVRLTISIVVPSERFNATETSGYVSILKRHAAALSRDLGFNRDSAKTNCITAEPYHTNMQQNSRTEERVHELRHRETQTANRLIHQEEEM